MQRFADHNPVAVAVYYLAAAGVCMFTMDPVVLAISLIGALVCSVLWPYTEELFSLLAGACTVFAIRALARHYRWNLPRA